VSLEAFDVKRVEQPKGIHAPTILTLLGLATLGDTRSWKRHQAAKPKWEGKHMLHAFCNKCVHINSKPNFQEAYLSEYGTKFNDLGLVGNLRMSRF